MSLPLDALARTKVVSGPGLAVLDAMRLAWIDDERFGPREITMLSAIDPTKLAKAELPTYIKNCDRAESIFAARRDRATLLMAGPDDRGKNYRELETPAHELCVALRIPLGAAHTEIYRSRRLALLPGTRRLYDQGLLTRKHVAKITTGTGHLTAEQCAEVERRVLTDAEMLSVREFARRIRRAVAQLNPREAKDRHDRAAASCDVSFEAGEDGIGWLTSTMPLLDAVICTKAYHAYALAKKKAGDPRPIGVLRAEAQRVFAEASLTGQLTGTVPTHHGRPVEVQVAVTPEALLGLADTPAEIPGIGPIPIELVRQMIHDAKLRWITISAANGRLLDRSPHTWRIPPDIHAHADQTYVDSVGPHSTVPADRCDGEHLIEYPGGPTTITNIAPMDRSWHIAKTHTPGMNVTRNPDGTITWTTPLGQTLTVQPYDYRLGP